ncbi:nucleotidyltransferase domain-containing protein [Vagococcus fluvialis]|uniref:nucleotidyltransferase domain-containing protein n=1 Tax=Vagococcus fluvialis TaxID=2738 RepID=UPI003D1255EC
MNKIKKQKIKEVEERENVKVILAVESGSRAWGFESQDSDYDVRFIYIREKDDYLKLEGLRDVIEWQLDDTLDINGWDIQKALKLLYKSNPTLFEWCSSPIVYHETSEADELRELLPIYFSDKKLLFHYWNMARTNYREYLKSDKVKAKKYFYVLRPILAANWVLAYNNYPPMEFEKLVDDQLRDDLKPIVYDLLEKKKSVNGLDLVDKIDVLNQYIEESIDNLEEQAQSSLDKNDNRWEPLNEFFLKMIDK